MRLRDLVCIPFHAAFAVLVLVVLSALPDESVAAQRFVGFVAIAVSRGKGDRWKSTASGSSGRMRARALSRFAWIGKRRPAKR